MYAPFAKRRLSHLPLAREVLYDVGVSRVHHLFDTTTIYLYGVYIFVSRCICVSPPEPIFRGRYLHSWDGAGAKKLGVGNISPSAFRKRIVRYWHPLGCRAIELGKPPPQGGVIYTVVYKTLLHIQGSPSVCG